MLISVIIPALNEAESIGQVLAALPLDRQDEVIVVDGGSSDATATLAQAAGARLVHEPRRGYGRACASGASAARGEWLVFLDADGADDPACLPALLAPLRAGQADLVLGSRLSGDMRAGAMPTHQRYGNRLAAWLIRRWYGQPLTDLSPFRALLRNRLVDLDMQEMTYGWPTEMIVKAARRGWRICEVPVPYRPRLGGRSKISGTLRGSFLATYHILSVLYRYSRA